MKRVVIALALLLAAGLGASAQDKPQLNVELAETQTIVGQPLVVRIKMLVPTWMPKPPEFPSLELPGLLVRLPEGASGPASERIGSETWSGVQRAYRIYPLQPGLYEIPGQTVGVTYARPGGTDPLTEQIRLEPIAFAAEVPGEARGLDPLIVANGFSLEATVEGQQGLEVGGAVVRTLTARIGGTTPILIPQLTPESTGKGLRTYSDEPRISESEEGGVLSGERLERTTYLATAEGAAELPALRFDWYNLETGAVETAEAPAVLLNVAPGAASKGFSRPVPWRAVVLGLLALAVIGAVARAAWPRLMAWRTALRRGWYASETYAHCQVLKALRDRELGRVYTALENWLGFHPALATEHLRDALGRVGKSRYAPVGLSTGEPGWNTLGTRYLATRRAALENKRQHKRRQVLNTLNPQW